MAQTHKIVEGLKDAVLGNIARSTTYIGCGNCKGTGWRQTWNAQALLVPVEPPEPCGYCNGTGMIRDSN